MAHLDSFDPMNFARTIQIRATSRVETKLIMASFKHCLMSILRFQLKALGLKEPLYLIHLL